jgi:hypothetical protein
VATYLRVRCRFIRRRRFSRRMSRIPERVSLTRHVTALIRAVVPEIIATILATISISDLDCQSRADSARPGLMSRRSTCGVAPQKALIAQYNALRDRALRPYAMFVTNLRLCTTDCVSKKIRRHNETPEDDRAFAIFNSHREHGDYGQRPTAGSPTRDPVGRTTGLWKFALANCAPPCSLLCRDVPTQRPARSADAHGSVMRFPRCQAARSTRRALFRYQEWA